MDEIEIELQILDMSEQQIQCDIHSLFSCGRWPTDEEFISINKTSADLITVEARIESLKSVSKAISFNLEYMKQEKQ